MPFKNERDWELHYSSFGSDGYWGAYSWDQLLNHTRVIILAEAGAGKTAELRAASDRIKSRNQAHGFVVTLNAVAKRGLEAALETSDDVTSFEKWKESETDAYFFLDSLDEARLSGSTFQEALSCLEKELSPHLHRARIYISCRVADWRAVSDEADFARYLRQDSEKKPDDNLIYDNADDALLKPLFDESQYNQTDDQPDKKADEKTEGPLVVALAPLSKQQASKLSEANGVTDVDRFLLALHKANATELANRPQDLLAMIEKWKSTGKIGTKFEALDWSIKTRLKETNLDISGLDTLTYEKAYDGAKFVATQLTLGQQRLLSWPIEAGQGITNQEAMDPSAVLPDFSGSETTRLLNRAIFDPATFGAVRLHHRDVQELLCAQWLLHRLADGCPVRRVWELLTNERSGKIRIRPALRPVAAWVAQLEPRIFRRVLDLEPQLLLEGGDPELIPIEERKQVLRKFAELHAGRDDAGISIDINQLARLATPELAPTIRGIWNNGSRSGEVRDLVLRLIWAGELEDLSDVAFAAVTSRRGEYERSIAARALMDIASPEQRKQLADYLIKHAKSFPARAMDAAIQVVFPRALDLVGLEQIIRKHPKHKRQTVHGGLNYGLEEIARGSDAATLQHLAMVLGRIAFEKPWVDSNETRVSKLWLHLMSPLLLGASKLVETADGGAVPSEIAQLIRKVLRRTEYGILDYQAGESRKKLTDALQANRTVNKQLYDLCLDEHADKPDDTWMFGNRFFNEPWTATEADFDIFVAALAAETQPNRKLCILHTCFAIARTADRLDELLPQIESAIGADGSLKAALDGLLNPPPRKIDDWEIEHNAKVESFKRQRRLKEQKNKDSWRDLRQDLTEKAHQVATESPFGLLYWARRWLRSEQRYADRDANDWRGFEQAFGTDVTNAVKDGMVQVWRRCDPGNIYRQGKLTNGGDVGRLGLSVELSRDPAFATQLSQEDVAIATRLAWTELSDIPDWALSIWDSRPEHAETPVRAEIRWELDRKSGDKRTSHVLYKLERAPEPFKSRLAEWVLEELIAKEPSNHEALNTCLNLITSSGLDALADLADLSAIRSKRSRRRQNRLIWLSMLMSTNGAAGIDALRSWLNSLPDLAARDELMVDFLATIFPIRGPSYGGSYQDYRRLPVIQHLLQLTYRHIRREDDLDHDGVFTPGPRDAAQDARNSILNILLDVPGNETYQALIELAEAPEFALSRERFKVLADQRAAKDADMKPWSSSDVLSFAQGHNQDPMTVEDLHRVIMDRMVDIKDEMESGEFTNRELLRQDHLPRAQERPIQLAVAQQLNLRRGTAYTSAREPEQEDKNEPDILVSHSHVVAPVPIEIKVGDSWTYREFVEAIEDQLIGKYLKENLRTHGVILITYHGKKKHWLLPDTRFQIDFSQLIQALQDEASRLEVDLEGSKSVSIVGISLV